MTSGYDRRTRQGKPQAYLYRSYTGATEYSGDTPQKSESVTSYRSNVLGTPLDPKAVDLYGGFFQRTSPADYFRPGPRLLASLQASGLSTADDYKSLTGEGIDNGHPFDKSSFTIGTSIRRQVTCRPSNQPLGIWVSGYPATVNQMTVSSGAAGRMPFQFDGSTEAENRTFSIARKIQSPSTSQLKSDGTQLLTGLTPASPKVRVTAMLLELLFGLPAVPGSAIVRGFDISKLGGEYLNIVFALLPTYDDAVKLAETLSHISKKIHQIRRDEGRRVRRRGGFPAVKKSEVFSGSEIQFAQGSVGLPYWGTRWNSFGGSGSTSLQTFWQSNDASAGNYPAVRQLTMSETRKVELSASFTYVLPEIPGFSGRLEKYLAAYDSLLGLSLSAQAAWQVTPFSWLIDWFLDVRQNIAAISVGHDDNHAVNYAYAMETVERTAMAELQFTNGTPVQGVKFVRTGQTASFKRRIRANPYGFVSESDSAAWGPYRLAVLAALGLTKA